jgi:hypothetical protein
MPSLKPHKTVEQIAKKHRLDVSFIQKQLDMGEPIEHEHTKDHQLSRYIALQHLDEIPDYYTRLKKMEASAKKEHKKFKDVKESQEEQRYCPLCDKRETRSECSYGEKAWDKVSVKDEEYSMVRSELKTLMDAAKRLNTMVGKGEGNLEAWVQSKITKAADYIDTAADYVSSGEMEEQKIVNKILSELQEGKKRGLWDNIHAKRKRGEKPANPGEEGYPKTLNVEENEIDEGLEQARKNVGAGKCWKGKKVGNPSTKMKGGKEVPNCVPENVTIEDSDGKTFAEVVDIIKPEPIKGFKSQIEEATRMPAQTGNIVAVTISWRGKYYSLKMFFPQSKLPSRKDINDELQKVYPNSRVVYHAVSEIQPGQPLIQAFGPQGGSFAKSGPNMNYVKPMGEEVEISEAKKSEMKCNNPKAEAHGSGETGKSHVVKACEGGKEKLIRFGQLGVKGSPKKEGESKEYASRRNRFKTRHAKNIAKGKMSAAYWANKVKW